MCSACMLTYSNNRPVTGMTLFGIYCLVAILTEDLLIFKHEHCVLQLTLAS